MNYKVILADDEQEMLWSIRKKVEWEKYGFEVTGAFLNGRDVLEFLENQEADLVFTDIRMPFMDGITLAREIRKKYPYMKVVIISGYDDFNYAKEAMTLSVTDYILKPINAREMAKVLQRIRESMDEEMAEKKNFFHLKKQYLESLPIIRENLLNRLVMGNAKKESLEKELESCSIELEGNTCWAVALIQIDGIDRQESEEAMDRQLASVYVKNLIKEKFCEEQSCYAFYNPLGECILFGMQEADEMGKMLFHLNDMARESRRVMGIRIAVGVGKRKEELIKVKESFAEAREALLYRKMTRDGDVICLEDIDTSEPDIILFDEESANKLFLAVRFGEKEDIRHAVNKLRKKLQEMNMRRSSYQAYRVSVLNALLVFVQQQNIETEEIFGGIPNYLEILSQYEDADDFLGWFEERCLMLGEYCGQARENKAKDIIGIAKKHMQQEFGNQDIGLEKIAAEVGLTPTYFSSLFKKETGESFVEYLTNIRMEEAMRMLKHTDEKIYVVAQRTGYPEPGYFSHVFKKKYGISPIQCRRQSR